MEKVSPENIETIVDGKQKAEMEDDGNEKKRKVPTSITDHNQNNGNVAPKENNNKKRIKIKRRVDPDVVNVRKTIQQCCRRDDLQTALEAYDQAMDKNVHIEAQSLYNLIALCDGLSDRGIHVGTPKAMESNKSTVTNNDDGDGDIGVDTEIQTVSLEHRKEHAFRIKKHMDDNRLPLTESAYSALIKLLSRSETDLDRAEEILIEAEGVQQCKPKLRMYSSILMAQCNQRSLIPALRIWLRLSMQDLQVSEREMAALIRCATQCQNATLMERVLTDLAEDVLVPSRETCQAIVEWFQCPAAAATAAASVTAENTLESQAKLSANETSMDEEVTSLLQQIHLPQQQRSLSSSPIPMGPVQHSHGWVVDRDCLIERGSGILQSGCLKGEHLQPVHISPETWNEMKAANETIVSSGKLDGHQSEFQGGRKGKKRQVDDPEKRRYHWRLFCEHLERRCRNNDKPDVVIDGANVGFAEQNFHGAPKHVSYVQIDWVVQHFCRQGKTVLLVMHSRHFSRNMMPQEFEPIVRRWSDMGILYRTPPGMNDDWFWMHAALHCGPGTCVLTNDELRDHHFQMLASRSFLRWKDRHQIHFAIGDWVTRDNNNIIGEGGGRSRREREILLTYPEIYSRRIQRVANGLVIPLPKRGDENRFMDGSHVADQDDIAKEESYVCIRPKQ